MNHPRTLVCCPTYAGKQYCLDAYIDAYNALEYEPKGVLMVDNTRGSTAYTEMIVEKGVRAIHINPLLTFEATFHRCWQLIHQEAVIEGFDWVFSVEQDTIVPPDALTLLMDIAQKGDFGVVTHTYPMHLLDQARNGRSPWMNKKRFCYNELGCALFSTKLLSLGLADTSRYRNFTEALFHSSNKYMTGWATVCNKLEIEHLDGYFMEYQQFIAQPDDGRWNPYEGVELPEHHASLPPVVLEDYKKLGVDLSYGSYGLKLEEGTYEAKAEGKVIKGGNGKVKRPRVKDIELRAEGVPHVTKD